MLALVRIFTLFTILSLVLVISITPISVASPTQISPASPNPSASQNPYLISSTIRAMISQFSHKHNRPSAHPPTYSGATSLRSTQLMQISAQISPELRKAIEDSKGTIIDEPSNSSLHVSIPLGNIDQLRGCSKSWKCSVTHGHRPSNRPAAVRV
jgi:hypothetical protein